MRAGAFDALATFFGYVWRFFTEIPVPGTNVSFASIFFLSLVVIVSLKFLKRIFNFHQDSSD